MHPGTCCEMLQLVEAFDAIIHTYVHILIPYIHAYIDEFAYVCSGTCCEMLLMVEAFDANIICPNKQVDDTSASYEDKSGSE